MRFHLSPLEKKLREEERNRSREEDEEKETKASQCSPPRSSSSSSSSSSVRDEFNVVITEDNSVSQGEQGADDSQGEEEGRVLGGDSHKVDDIDRNFVASTETVGNDTVEKEEEEEVVEEDDLEFTKFVAGLRREVACDHTEVSPVFFMCHINFHKSFWT